MQGLSVTEFNVVQNALSFAIASMFGTTLFFLVVRSDVARIYRSAIATGAMVTGVAGYHYVRIASAWSASWKYNGDFYVPSGVLFSDIFRYVDWLVTVPLICVTLVLALNLPQKARASMMPKLIAATVSMCTIGYIGEMAGDLFYKAMAGLVACIPFIFIVSVLFGELDAHTRGQTKAVRAALARSRLWLVISWFFYPAVYFFSLLGFDGSTVRVILEVGYTLADVSAKCIYGLTVYWLIREKMHSAGEDVEDIRRVRVIESVAVPVTLAPPPVVEEAAIAAARGMK
jgi:bacteriorhodopsin